MKAAVVGVGQAGGKLAQALTEYDSRTGFDAVEGALAVNTARQDLEGLDLPTVLVGQERVAGNGVGGDNELGASVMQADAPMVLDELDGIVRSSTEAIFVAAGLGGGTGSGGAPVLARQLSRVYDAPVYVLGVLPGKDEGALYQANAGRSLKTVSREADAVLLVDNDAWREAGESVGDAYAAINERVAKRVGLLLASGEAVQGVGESVVDSSEVINTLRKGGLAVLGFADAPAAADAGENVNVITSTARKALLTGTSVPNVVDADAALVVVAGDTDRLSRKGVERARQWVQEQTGSMEVRGGDFPLDGEKLAVLVLLAGVTRNDHIQSFVDRARDAAEADAEDAPDPAAAFENDELDGLF
ncbi:tubulin/FtsZ family protein [Halocalculus aciditolerans]|uniref:Tubulin-like protein CetZ n=1 Tax=Halocalculus aciditolerans TaxID=1383812 RepID=A0A830FB84_9EURY|nr:tubulin/FtsZ family protein [Halocalculus aciditolerans]GGL72600.1 cell division protein [Halocalculus aciditolerans]